MSFVGRLLGGNGIESCLEEVIDLMNCYFEMKYSTLLFGINNERNWWYLFEGVMMRFDWIFDIEIRIILLIIDR